MSRIRFVFDTNCLISAVLSPQSTVAQALRKAESGGQIVYSSQTIDEFSTVLLRKKFDKYFTVDQRLEIMNRIAIRYKLVIPKVAISECRDPKDNMFLELAYSAKAQYIITGDKDLLIMHPFRNIKIISPTDLLALTHF